MIPELHKLTPKTTSAGGVLNTIDYPKYALVSTHTARRSFVSNLILDGIPAHNICQITGHSSEQMLLNYCKVKPRESISKVLDLFSSK